MSPHILGWDGIWAEIERFTELVVIIFEMQGTREINKFKKLKISRY